MIWLARFFITMFTLRYSSGHCRLSISHATSGSEDLRCVLFCVEKITCLPALVQNVNLKLVIQTSRQAKMKKIQWKKTSNRRHDRHWCYRSLVVLIRLHSCLVSYLIQYNRDTVIIASCWNRKVEQTPRGANLVARHGFKGKAHGTRLPGEVVSFNTFRAMQRDIAPLVVG